MHALVDNDILFKGARYGLLNRLVGPNTSPAVIGVLGAAPYVVIGRIQKTANSSEAVAAIKELNDFWPRSIALEPSEVEQRMAADFELAAQRAGVALDAGESQLCALLIAREVGWLLTGDKRAIEAIEHLLDGDSRLQRLCGRIKCLEQLVLERLSQSSFAALRAAICGAREVDKALAICFSCTAASTSLENVIACLESYVNDLRSRARHVLF